MLDLRHVKLKGFAKVVQDAESLRVTFLDNAGKMIGDKPLVFSGSLPHERAHKTTLDGNEVYFFEDFPVVFDKEWFDNKSQQMPFLGKWADAVRLNIIADMDPKHEPPLGGNLLK